MQPLLLVLPTRFETERLVLRAYQAGDGAWFYPMSQRNKQHLARYEYNNVVMKINSPEDAEVTVRRLALDWMARESFSIGVFLRDTQQFVANIYLGPVKWDLPEFELGYFVDVDQQGKGYITEAARRALQFAFDDLQAQRVRLMCADTNLRSLAVAERCGMVREGHLRLDTKFPDGSITGTLVYGLLQSEWEGLAGD